MSETYILYIRKQVYNKTEMFRECLHRFQDYLVQKRRLFVKVQHILVDRGTQRWFGFVVSTQQQKAMFCCL